MYLGFRLLARRGTHVGAPGSGAPTVEGHALWRGFVTNITNPKSAAFFTSIFASIVPPGQPAAVLLALACCIGAVSLGWHCLLAWAFSTAPIRSAFKRRRSACEAVCGALLLGVGARFLAG